MSKSVVASSSSESEESVYDHREYTDENFDSKLQKLNE